MLADEAAGSKLRRVADAARAGPPLAAFTVAADAGNKLAWFGAAFWTKFMCFCSLIDRHTSGAPDRNVAPILDNLVARWIRDETGVWFDPVTSKYRDYQRYLDTIGDWADQLDLRCDILEELIFRSAEGVSALKPRPDWSDDSVADHQAVERFRFHFHDRLPEAAGSALDDLETTFRPTREL